MKRYQFSYKVEPFVDVFKRTVEADTEEKALLLWKKSILSYHATLVNVKEVE